MAVETTNSKQVLCKQVVIEPSELAAQLRRQGKSLEADLIEAAEEAQRAFEYQIQITETEMGEEGAKRWTRPDPLATLMHVYAATAPVSKLRAALAALCAKAGAQ